MSDIGVGDKIKHNIYGDGIILKSKYLNNPLHLILFNEKRDMFHDGRIAGIKYPERCHWEHKESFEIVSKWDGNGIFKIKEWDALEKEFGLCENDAIHLGDLHFPKLMEDDLPDDRIIEIKNFYWKGWKFSSNILERMIIPATGGYVKSFPWLDGKNESDFWDDISKGKYAFLPKPMLGSEEFKKMYLGQWHWDTDKYFTRCFPRNNGKTELNRADKTRAEIEIKRLISSEGLSEISKEMQEKIHKEVDKIMNKLYKEQEDKITKELFTKGESMLTMRFKKDGTIKITNDEDKTIDPLNKYHFRGEVNLDVIMNDCIRDGKRSFIVSGKENAVVGIMANTFLDIDGYEDFVEYQDGEFIVKRDMISPFIFKIINKKEVDSYIKILRNERRDFNKSILKMKDKIKKKTKQGKNVGDSMMVFTIDN